MIYTSGSTGPPKGVVVTHTGIAALAWSHVDRLGIGPDSRVLQYASFSFDTSVVDLVMGLAAGAALVVAEERQRLSGGGVGAIAGAARRDACDVAAWVAGGATGWVLAGGDDGGGGGGGVPGEVVARWSAQRELFNAYGPTEATVCATLAGPLQGRADAPPIWSADGGGAGVCAG